MSQKFEFLLGYHCAPALLGVKSANLINCSLCEYPMIEEYLLELNSTFNPHINFTVLNKTSKNVLILVYKPDTLNSVIFNERNFEYLEKHDYHGKDLSNILLNLSRKIKLQKCFPHEIGIFLNYDLDDIIAFENGNPNCLYTGYWKVFSNLESKLQTFEVYTCARNKVIENLKKGKHLKTILNI